MSQNALTDRDEIFTERRGDTGARFACKNCTIEKKPKKCQYEVSLGRRPGDAIEMSVSTRAFEWW